MTIDNFASVTAAAGTGINAFNLGNGSVTLIDEKNTTVFGAQFGITASSSGPNSGSVAISVGDATGGATVSAGALYGLAAISASESNAGNITITTFAGDIINSGGTGIQAGNQATNASSLSQISITARGNINSGYNMSQGGGQPGGIWAGYTPGGVQTANANVAGNVSVDSGATINSASGVGIGLYNWGAGNITATLQSSNSITAAAAGLNIFAQGGGNVLITNPGTITAATGTGIAAGTGTGLNATGNGTLSISNTGSITALGSGSNSVIQLNNNSAQGATFANSITGTVTANLFSTSSLNVALGVNNGSLVTNNGGVTVNNSGTISGNVALGTSPFNMIIAATFNNNSGAVWNVNGSNSFGGASNAINNFGTINVAGASGFYSAVVGAFTFSNSGFVNVLANSAAYIGANVPDNVSGNGTFIINNRADL